MGGAKARTSGGNTLSSYRTSPLRPKPGLSGPPVGRGTIDVMRKGSCYIGLMCMTLSVCLSQVRDRLPYEVRLGYELYSWPRSSGGWNFCIRPNTEREATVEEVFNNEGILRGVDQLKRRISQLPAGAKIFWVDRIPSGNGPRAKGSEILGYPSSEIREQIRHYANRHHVDIEVLDPLVNP